MTPAELGEHLVALLVDRIADEVAAKASRTRVGLRVGQRSVVVRGAAVPGDYFGDARESDVPFFVFEALSEAQLVSVAAQWLGGRPATEVVRLAASPSVVLLEQMGVHEQGREAYVAAVWESFLEEADRYDRDEIEEDWFWRRSPNREAMYVAVRAASKHPVLSSFPPWWQRSDLALSAATLGAYLMRPVLSWGDGYLVMRDRTVVWGPGGLREALTAWAELLAPASPAAYGALPEGHPAWRLL
jgi:hypothetical protein